MRAFNKRAISTSDPSGNRWNQKRPSTRKWLDICRLVLVRTMSAPRCRLMHRDKTLPDIAGWGSRAIERFLTFSNSKYLIKNNRIELSVRNDIIVNSFTDNLWLIYLMAAEHWQTFRCVLFVFVFRFDSFAALLIFNVIHSRVLSWLQSGAWQHTHTRTHLLLVKWKWRTGKVFAELKCVASFTWFCNCCCLRRRRHWSCLFICSYRSASAHSMWLYCNWCCSVCGACILFRIIVIGWHHKMQMAATTLFHFPFFFARQIIIDRYFIHAIAKPPLCSHMHTIIIINLSGVFIQFSAHT